MRGGGHVLTLKLVTAEAVSDFCEWSLLATHPHSPHCQFYRRHLQAVPTHHHQHLQAVPTRHPTTDTAAGICGRSPLTAHHLPTSANTATGICEWSLLAAHCRLQMVPSSLERHQLVM